MSSNIVCGLIIAWFIWWLFTHREREERNTKALIYWIMNSERDYHE